MVGVILAAGDGVRLKESTGEDGCKVLKKINGKPLIEFSLDNLIALNITEAVIVVGKYGDLIQEAIGNAYNGLHISYVRQKRPIGLMHAFVQGLAGITTGEDVVLQLADEIFIALKTEEIKACMEAMTFDFYCGMTYENNPEKIKANFSIETAEHAVIRKCTEKPSVVENNMKGTGFCIFKHPVLQMLKTIYDDDANTPKDLCDFINLLIAENKKGIAFCVAEREFNINTVSDLEEANAFLQKE